jgi:hypothetical protein
VDAFGLVGLIVEDFLGDGAKEVVAGDLPSMDA